MTDVREQAAQELRDIYSVLYPDQTIYVTDAAIDAHINYGAPVARFWLAARAWSLNSCIGKSAMIM